MTLLLQEHFMRTGDSSAWHEMTFECAFRAIVTRIKMLSEIESLNLKAMSA
jgi:hypothetical protein